ncbi:RNA-binding domain-containing protein [Gyrodon lividus]|nr:RNA-binding domain-containing protein [Gyrodon lividus]
MADTDATQTALNGGIDPAIDDGEEAESKEIQLMKQRVEEMEREAKKLRELQAAAESQSAAGGAATDQGVPMETEEDRAIADGRSIFVGNVDYSATPEEIQGHFQACGTINRVTILCDKFTGHPKGFAYVEFAEPEFIDAALAMDSSLFRGRLIKVTAKRTNVPGFNRARLMSSSASSPGYPFSKTAILPVPLPIPPGRQETLQKGKGLMAFLHQALPEPKKREWLATFFSRRHPDRLLPGSVLTVTTEHAPGIFSGVLISVRRRGPDTSFVLRNVIQRTGIEMQFFVNSPHLKDIKVRQRAGEHKGNKQRRAKLFFLRDSPDKMTAISAGVKGPAASSPS